MNASTIFAILLAVFLGLTACVPTNTTIDSAEEKPRWFNTTVFNSIETIGDSLYDLAFKLTFSDSQGNEYQLKSCIDISSISEDEIAENEFARWELLRANCEAASRYYSAPESSTSFWQREFDIGVLKSLPATTIPNLGGNSLDGHMGTLGGKNKPLNLIEAHKNNIKISINDTVVDYVVLAKGDFNRDGVEDWFIRLDWHITSAYGMGFDWVVLTKLSADSRPLLLWRK